MYFNASCFHGARLHNLINQCCKRNVSAFTKLTPTSNHCKAVVRTNIWLSPKNGSRSWGSCLQRWMSQRTHKTTDEVRKRSTLLYISGVAVMVVGLSYAAVPLYTIFCQATSYGGQTAVGHDADKVGGMQKVAHRKISVRFNADTVSSLTWSFRPQQSEIFVAPGETALAFYTATNPTDRPITGIATYNVLPFEAGQYFNKIQCFCFEEQRLNPHEQVDMPVFFYIDPEFADDPKLENVNQIMLSYTFFEAKEGLVLPVPAYAQSH